MIAFIVSLVIGLTVRSMTKDVEQATQPHVSQRRD